MKSNGVYAGAIALIAIVVIAGAVFVSQGTALAEGQKNNASTIVETKAAWQNARYLLDKTAAFVVLGVEEDCAYDADEIKTLAEITFSDLLENAHNINCSIAEGSVAANAITGNSQFYADISATVRCGRSDKGFFVEYEKTVTFKKTGYFPESCVAGDGQRDVLDRDSGACEIDRWIGGGCGS